MAGEVQRSVWDYPVSEAAAIVACVLFGISTLGSIYQTIKTRAWIWFVMILAIAAETAGYAIRIVSAKNPTNVDLYAAQFCLIILPPVLMAGIIYVAFGRIVFLVVPPAERTIRLLWAPARWLTPIFVAFDVLALFLQTVGALMLTNIDATDSDYKSKIDRGRTIALIGVSTQLVAFGFFSILAVRFHFISKRFEGLNGQVLNSTDGKKGSPSGSGRQFNPRWNRLLLTINASCLLILIRSIYREVEFVQGNEGYIMTHEWPTYVFDALPMLIAVAIYNLCPPGDFVHMGFRQPKNQTFPAESLPPRGASSSTSGYGEGYDLEGLRR